MKIIKPLNPTSPRAHLLSGEGIDYHRAGEVRQVPYGLKTNSRILRKAQTPEEDKLWYYLRNRKLKGLKFRRQHPIGPFIADFFAWNTGSSSSLMVVNMERQSSAKKITKEING